MKDYSDFGISFTGSGTQVATTCPKCSKDRRKKKAKCLSVNTDEKIWLCHHCGWSGSLLSGTDDSLGLHWRKPEFRKPEPMPKSDLPEATLDWLSKRGISEETAIDCGIGMKKVYMPQSEEEKMALTFPYYRNGDLVNVKYRSGSKEFRSEVNAERILYGLDDISDEDGVVIFVEGEMDKLSLYEAGIKQCVSVPDGAPSVESKNYSSKFEFLNEPRINGVEKGRTYIIAVDNDAPGQRLQEELARRLGKEVCSRVTWPEECKDANDVLVKHGKKVLAECIEHAEPYPIAGTFTASDLSDKLGELYDNGLEKGISTGWPCLDKHYLVRPGCFSVVTGIPCSGKSNWIDSMMVNIAKKEGWRFAIFSPENQPLEDHMSRIMEKYIEAPFRQGFNRRMTKEELNYAKDWVKEHFHWILPEDDSEWTLEKILETARGLVRRYGIRGLVIDPWNELESGRGGLSETEYIGMCLKRARQFARRYGIHLWIVAHPAKMYRDKDGSYPVPSLWDISGSAHWRNKSDSGVVIYRDLSDPDSKLVDIHIQKQRFRQDGAMGMASLRYNPIVGDYYEAR